jgi:hypothetical protein
LNVIALSLQLEFTWYTSNVPFWVTASTNSRSVALLMVTPGGMVERLNLRNVVLPCCTASEPWVPKFLVGCPLLVKASAIGMADCAKLNVENKHVVATARKAKRRSGMTSPSPTASN